MTGAPVHIPVVETERLVLRGPRFDDLDWLAAMMAGERTEFIGGPIGRNDSWRMLLRISGHWQMRGYGLWFIEERDSARMAGWAGLLHQIEWPEPELAYTVVEGFEGKGFAREAVLAARKAAADLFGIHSPISHIHPGNTRSRRLAEGIGAVFERDGEIHGERVEIWRHPAIGAEQ